ncbi:MAG: wax ester/triacylglycerol synthase family O-acyltransferase [Actinomycetia bacterium]|nr:wax ester/triacylglycerol synthase family O-acyltransferase [Actinomycetes bacterium]
MKQLSGLDAGFLYMETPTTFGHINSVSIYERPRTRGFKPYELFRGQIESRLDQLEPLRRRLVEVPFGLDHPWWIEDPDFDLDFHLRHIAAPPPGGDRELADLVARIISRPLDRRRPLWEAYVIEGLKQRRWAVLLKVHHATIDGASGAELLTLLLDDQPDDGTSREPSAPSAKGPESKPEAVPSPTQMLTRTALNFAMRPERMARAQLKAWRQATDIATRHRGESIAANLPSKPLGPAPTTPFNKAISPQRRFAFRTTSLDDIKAIKNHFGATVNDVVMAACAGGLRHYLQNHDQLSDRPLLAAVPVSMRTGDETEKWTNRVSSIVAALPTHLEDRLERLAFTNSSMNEAKATFDLVPMDALVDFSQFSPPALFTETAAIATRMRLADRLNPAVNLIISNVPGPRQALYLGPCKLAHYYPVSTIAEGQGLNITVQSYEDKLDFGLVGCRELMPDIWDVLDYVVEEITAFTALIED